MSEASKHYNAHISPSYRSGKVDSNNRWIGEADVGNCDLPSDRVPDNPSQRSDCNFRYRYPFDRRPNFAICDPIFQDFANLTEIHSQICVTAEF